MNLILDKVKEEGILKKISSYIAIPMKITDILNEDSIKKSIEKKIKKKDYPYLYNLKKTNFYDDFSFFISDMQRLPYYQNQMIDLNVFLNSLEKLANNKHIYEYGEIPDSMASDEDSMLKTFKKYGFKIYKQNGGKKIKKNIKTTKNIKKKKQNKQK